MNDADHDPDGRVALEALSAAFADPHRLVDELLAAEADEDARRLGGAFGLTGDQAQTVQDNRFPLLTRGRRAELAENLRVAQTPLGPPLHLRAVVDATGARASVVVDGVESTGGGRTAAESVEALAKRVSELSRYRHCRVVVVVDGPSRLERLVATPTRGGPTGATRSTGPERDTAPLLGAGTPFDGSISWPCPRIGCSDPGMRR